MSTSILNEVRKTVADTLNVSLPTITENSSTENTGAWDSLAQVNLMIALEQTFDIVLDVDDFMALNSVVAITSFLEQRVEQ